MKLLITAPRFKPGVGGAEEVVYCLAKALIERGHHVVVYTSNLLKTSPSYAYLAEGVSEFDGIPVRRFHALPFLKNYPILPGMTARLLEEKPDLIHSHVYGSFTTDVASAIAWAKKIPFVLTPHGFFLNHPLSGAYVCLSRLNSLAAARRLICLSNAEVNTYVKLIDPRKIALIPNGIDIDYWRKLPKRGAFRRKVHTNSRMIAAVGRITFGKGFQYLLKAMPIILKTFPDLTLVVAGEDFGYLGELRRLISDLKLDRSVVYVSPTREEIKEIYVDSDLVVIPSLYEGFSLVALEAMACAKPVIASSVGGLTDIVKHSLNGLLVSPCNPVGLAKAIVTLLQDDEAARRIGIRNKREVLNYSWRSIVEKIQDLYRELLQNR